MTYWKKGKAKGWTTKQEKRAELSRELSAQGKARSQDGRTVVPWSEQDKKRFG